MNDDGGYTKSFRRKWRNPVFLNFRDAAVWAYLTDNAAWRDNTDVRFEGARVVLMAGQIAVSERFLAEGFCCDRQVIRRIFEALEKDQMITRQKTHRTTIITICNYKQYQSSDDYEKPADALEKTQSKPSRNPNINEENESKNHEDVILTRADVRAHTPVADELMRIVRRTYDDFGWIGIMERVRQWIARGWSPEDLIFPAAKKYMLEHSGVPPPNRQYLEKVIESFAEEVSRPAQDFTDVKLSDRNKRPAKPSLDEQLAELDRLRSREPGPLESFPDPAGGIVIDQPEQRH